MSRQAWSEHNHTYQIKPSHAVSRLTVLHVEEEEDVNSSQNKIEEPPSACWPYDIRLLGHHPKSCSQPVDTWNRHSPIMLFLFFFCTLLQWWMLILNRVKVSNSFSTVRSVWCQRQRQSLAAHNWLWRLTDDPEDPLFEDTCEEHENGKPGSQHTDLPKEKPYVYQKHKQNNKTHAYDMPNTDAVALLILLDTML